MRAVTEAYKSGAPNADVGASDAGSSFVLVGAAPVDISALPAFKTVVSSGACIVEVSVDGTSWSQAFAFQNAGGQEARVYGQFARVTGGAPVWMGGANEGEGVGWPAFSVQTKRIYARLTGSDVSGDGTLATPYRTFQRAVRDLPRQVLPGERIIVDVTGIGTEVLPADYALPALDCPFGLDFSSAFGPDGIFPFQIGTALEFIAIPQPAAGLSGPNVLTLAEMNGPGSGGGFGPGVYLDPDTNLVEIHTNQSYAADELRGKPIQSALGTCGVCWHNTAGPNSIIYTSRASIFEEWLSPMFSSPAFFPFAPAAPFVIQDQSAELITSNAPSDIIKPGFVIGGSGSMGIRGIKFTPAAPNPTGFPVQTYGSRTIFWENCDMMGFGAFHGSGCNIFLSSNIQGGAFASQVPICWISSTFLDMAAINIGWSTPQVFLGLGFVIDNCPAFGVRLDALTPVGRGPMYDLQLRNGVIHAPVPDMNFARIAAPDNFPAPFFPFSLAPPLWTPAYGILIRGGKAMIDHVKIFGCAADPIHIEAAFGLVEIKSVTGGEGGMIYGLPNTNGGIGLSVDDGTHVRCEDNDPSPGVATSVSGAGGIGVADYKVGDLAVGTWAALHGGADQYDITAVGVGGATGTGTRLFEKP
jgi:hypothetical protein